MSDTRTSDVSEDFARPPRTIVLCFDGTRGQYDSMVYPVYEGRLDETAQSRLG